MYLSKSASAAAPAMTSPKRLLSLCALAASLVGFSSTASAGCEYVISNQWSTGFTASIRISNTGTSAINGWNVAWQYAGSDRITSSWNATVTGSNPYAATGLNWNSSIQPGQSVEFGFQGTKNNGASAEVPAITGSACSGVVTSTSSSVATSSKTSTSSSVPSSTSTSTSKSTSAATTSSVASSSCAATSQCNWYGTLYPSCVTTTSGWGYENGKSCIANSTCASQPAPYGVVNGCPVSSSSATVTSTSTSTSKSSTSTSLSTSVATSTSSKTSSSTSSSTSSAVVGLAFKGVSLAGAEFGQNNIPGIYEKDYIYPDQTETDYFKGKGMNTLRVPFLWERLQRTLNADFDATELSRLDAFVTATTAKGVNVVLDPHNYARYNGQVIGSGVSNAAFADFWSRLATRYKSNSKVIFAIMNEPNTMPTEQWLSAANAAIAAIRAAGASNLILVPGNAWTGGWSWDQNWYGTSNATVMKGVVDSGNNYAIEVHQYLDSDGSGTATSCVSATIGVERLTAFTAWANANGKRAFLGEFAGGDNSTCKEAVQRMLQYMQDNNNVWMGWTWWAAGPWWADYMYTLEPKAGADRPQMSWLAPYLF